MRRALAFVVAAFAFASAAAAQEPLEVEDVLAASAEHYPSILEALAARRAAEGRALSAEGAFDVVFETESYARLSGFYDGRTLETGLKRNLERFGANVYGGYRVSDGDFPIYEDEYFTNRAGEAKAGVFFSLLRDRAIDERRFKRRDARLAVEQSEYDVALTKIGVQRQARRAYFDWLGAGRRLEVLRDLQNLAEERERGLLKEVAAGARAEIVVTENRQNISRRRVLVEDAERAFAAAAQRLSLYLRGPDGRPQTPAADRLPPRFPAFSRADDLVAADAEAALERRPELDKLAVGLERAQTRLALGRNELRPRLDVVYELSRDFGAIGEGGPSRVGTENTVRVAFSVPLQRRFGEGKVREASAEIEALERRLQLTEEQIRVELGQIRLELTAARRIAELAGQEADFAAEMRSAESRRFSAGASDYFVVNLREEAAADADLRRIDALVRREHALTDLYAAFVAQDALGVSLSSSD